MPTEHAGPPVITVVEAPACHFCHDAREALADLGRVHRLTVRTVDAGSAEGRALVAEHRPAMAPLVLLDGAYFSSGRLPRKKLVKVLVDRGVGAGA